MKLCDLALTFFLFVNSTALSRADDEDIPGVDVQCTNPTRRLRFSAPDVDEDRCLDLPVKDEAIYPDDFGGVFSQSKIYTCSDKRVIISNGIPDHDLTLHRSVQPCETNWAVEFPLDPPNPDPERADTDNTEIPIRGMIAMALNGVPAYGPQESDGLSAVEPTGSVQDAQYWYGHPDSNGGWHVHSPQMGEQTVTETTFLGYAMDGFKIYGPLEGTMEEVSEILDVCNGREVDGQYQYHVRTIAQVNGTAPYCTDDYDPYVQWNYVLGCYAGDVSDVETFDATNYTLDSDCVLEYLGPCTDDPDYLQLDIDGRTCDWVAEKPENRCDLADDTMTKCPAACNTTECAVVATCSDNPDYFYNGNQDKTCEWVAEKPDDRCFKDDLAFYECPVACGNTECETQSPTGGCSDSSDYFYNGNEDKTCEWVAEKPDDRCFKDDLAFYECPVACGNTECETLQPVIKLPNIIVIQPDDLVHMDEWSPPPDTPIRASSNSIPTDGMPNIEELRTNGLQMMQAYTASPVCGTSRYSTITGKMPSRAGSVRKQWDGEEPAEVTIPRTKLKDTNEQDDCSTENMAQAFASAGYKTAMVGKWHLTRFDTDNTGKDNSYNYTNAVGIVGECGFSYVGGLYIENMESDSSQYDLYSDGSYSHNMEWITYEAISFINQTASDGDNFFMYFNPTTPHSSMNVRSALDDFNCDDTPAGDDFTIGDPWIKGMVEDEGCRAYRDNLIERGEYDEDEIGKLWVDDAVGALMQALRDNGIFDDTIIIFQEDHGMDAKSTLYEGGIRIPQFIHYPNGIPPGQFDAPVSVVDIAATMFDFANIDDPGYTLDGLSWKDVVGNPTKEEWWKHERCLFFEVEQDRAVRCGCYKYIDMMDGSDTYNQGGIYGLDNTIGGVFFDLCDGGTDYITDNENNREEAGENISAPSGIDLEAVLACHETNTHPDADPVFDKCYDNTLEPLICADDTDYLQLDIDGRTCDWVAEKPENRCDLADDTMTKCPAACGQCGE